MSHVTGMMFYVTEAEKFELNKNGINLIIETWQKVPRNEEIYIKLRNESANNAFSLNNVIATEKMYYQFNMIIPN